MKNLIFICILIMSCSNLSTNSVEEGEYLFRSGYYKSKSWDNHLIFKRYSWFHELSLYFDVLVSEVDSSSPFYSWFSESEKRSMVKCKQRYIALYYALSADRISKARFKKELRNNNLTILQLPNFSEHLVAHQDYLNNNFKQYSIGLICNSGQANLDTLTISFPGFQSKKIILE